jgi:hypothetical protein
MGKISRKGRELESGRRENLTWVYFRIERVGKEKGLGVVMVEKELKVVMEKELEMVVKRGLGIVVKKGFI